MKNRRWGCLILVCLSFGACAKDEPADREHVSTIPWNRPEKWEGGQGALGGAFNPENTRY